MALVTQAKKELRKTIAQRLAAVSSDEIDEQCTYTLRVGVLFPFALTIAERIAAAVRALPEYANAASVALYMHMDMGEARTTHLIRNSFADKKRVFLPRIVRIPENADKQFPKQTHELQMLEMHSWDDVESLEPRGKYKLREPTSGTDGKFVPMLADFGFKHNQWLTTVFDAGGLDLVLLPGVGFTRSCKRLGHGKGYYDSFLAKHYHWSEKNTKKTPTVIGIGLTQQLVDDLPREPHDRALDRVVIGGTVYTAEPPSASPAM